MKSQVTLLTSMLRDCAMEVGFNSDRDERTIADRSKAEGNQFLEITLPMFWDAVSDGLENMRFPSIEGWALQRNSTLPKFLYGATSKVWRDDGHIHYMPDVSAISLLSQILRSYKKIFEVCSEERVQQALDGFVATDRELSRLKIPRSLEASRDVAHTLFGSAVGKAQGLWFSAMAPEQSQNA